MAETLHSGGEAGRGGDGGARWYACYTRARHEKQVDRLLQDRGIESYLPLIPRVSRWRDRTKSVEWPLFPSYVFARFALVDLYWVLEVPGLSTVVKVNGMPVPIPEEELENVRLLVAALHAGPVKTEPVPYYGEGQWVEVVDGPFRGLRGVVEQRRRRRRVLIGVRAIGQGLELDVDVYQVQPIDPP
jgi:transcription antitermination factor NusG